MNKLLLSLLSIILLLVCCTKNDILTEKGSLATETVKLYFATTSIGQNTILTCFNADNTVKWKKELDGFPDGVKPAYYNGILSLRTSHFSFEPDGSSFSYSNFFVIDANTGNEVWSKTNSKDYLAGPVMRNDTIFCSFAKDYSNGIAAYNAKTGALFWEHYLGVPFPPSYLHLDGNVLYFINSASNTVSRINAFDLNGKEIVWKTPIGINLSNVFSSPVFVDDKIYIANGTGHILAINKQSGTILWQENGPEYHQPVYGNNNIFSYKKYEGLFALNASNGLAIWHKQEYGDIWAPPYFSGQNLFVISNSNIDFISCLNPNNGDVIWQSELDPVKYKYQNLSDLVVVGENLYVNVFDTNNPNALIANYLIFDASTGKVKDSIQLAGTENAPLGILTTSGNYYGSN